MTTPPLTDRQREVYDFIATHSREKGYPPTVREIGLEFDILSLNGVICHLKSLERKGLITRQHNTSRAIQLTNPEQPEVAALPPDWMILAAFDSLAGSYGRDVGVFIEWLSIHWSSLPPVTIRELRSYLSVMPTDLNREPWLKFLALWRDI